jgi:hypothetical protein
MTEDLTGMIQSLFSLQKGDEVAFDHLAMRIFRYQFEQVPVYGSFCKMLKITPDKVKNYKQIPCLPTQAFQKHLLHDQTDKDVLVFRSSSTTSQTPSVHRVNDANIYIESFTKGFTEAFPEWRKSYFYALLPGYLERKDSSLVYMCEHLIKNALGGGFYLNQLDELAGHMQKHEEAGELYFLLGVTYALLDFCAMHPMKIKQGIIIETGGMKGKRREMCKDELHEKLSQDFGTMRIYGEYGMTELLSQAYAREDKRYEPSTFMRVKTMEVNDPFRELGAGDAGMLHILDLANIHSCSFIATSDLGRVYHDGSFEVLGRLDHAELRGCNLMIPA